MDYEFLDEGGNKKSIVTGKAGWKKGISFIVGKVLH